MKRALENLRGSVFWSLDRLKGGNVTKHYNDINNILSPDAKQKVDDKIDDRLQSLLKHATETTEFYRKVNGSISDFPVVNKSIIRGLEVEFYSKKFGPSEVVPTVTSGSTGTPFKVLHDHNKKYRNSADTLYFASLGGFTVGERLAYMKIWSQANQKSSLQSWLQNVLPLDVFKLDDAKISSFIKEIESDPSSFGFLAYASALEQICKYLDKSNYGKVSANVKSVIAMSESLNDYTKATIMKYFGVPVGKD